MFRVCPSGTMRCIDPLTAFCWSTARVVRHLLRCRPPEDRHQVESRLRVQALNGPGHGGEDARLLAHLDGHRIELRADVSFVTFGGLRRSPRIRSGGGEGERWNRLPGDSLRWNIIETHGTVSSEKLRAMARLRGRSRLGEPHFPQNIVRCRPSKTS
jgi:hypothetical protein